MRYSLKQKLRLIFVMLPLKGLYYGLLPIVNLHNFIIEKYNELDEKYFQELWLENNKK